MTDDDEAGLTKDKPKSAVKKTNLNMDAATLHILGDLVNSAGVLVSATLIYYFPHLWYLDPLCSYLFALISIYTTKQTLVDCFSLLLEKSPDQIDIESVKDSLIRIQGVNSLHEVHLWAVSNHKIAFSCHLKLEESVPGEESQRILAEAEQILNRNYGLNFENCIQIEFKSQTHQLLCH